jgi:formylglycine-generating enzyme
METIGMRSLRTSLASLCVAALCTVTTVAVRAQALVSYEWVEVGSPGNLPDFTTFGAVPYEFRIGKFEVTVEQYAAFLNAVAKTDTYGLWNNGMQASVNIAGITRSGSPGSYVYAAMTATSGSAPYSSTGIPPFRSATGVDSSKFPITFVSAFNAARFANWMANGQPTGLQDGSTTEDGAYPVSGARNSGPMPRRNDINPNTGLPPTVYLPSENEWYKAAYYDPALNSGAGGYHRYATRSDTAPGNVVPGSAFSASEPESNRANYIYGKQYLYSVTQRPEILATPYLTPVGSFPDAPSPWGALDMNGNVWEVNTLTGEGTPNVGSRGGAWTSLASYLASTYYLGSVPYSSAVNVGFRLAAPATAR